MIDSIALQVQSPKLPLMLPYCRSNRDNAVPVKSPASRDAGVQRDLKVSMGENFSCLYFCYLFYSKRFSSDE